MTSAPDPLPLSIFATGLETVFLTQEAASVLALRTAALSGFRPLHPGEAAKMVSEKPPAFAAAALAAWFAASGGQRADEVFAAFTRPLRAEARANVARLLSAP